MTYPHRAPLERSTSHSNRVRLLRRLLPGLSIVAVLLIAVWSSLETFFEKKIEGIPTQLKTQITQNTLVNPRIQSTDATGKPYTINAKSATHDQNTPDTMVEKPTATLEQQDGSSLILSADKGHLNQQEQTFLYKENVHLKHSQGFEFSTDQAVMDLKSQTVNSTSPLSGTSPFGTLSADKGFTARKSSKTLHFNGLTTLVIRNQETPTAAPLTIVSPTGIVCDQSGKTCTATGPITATKETKTLTCQRLVLTLYLNPKTQKNELKQIEAFGSVLLKDSANDLKATGHHALYDPHQETVRLDGKPVITDKETTLKGCTEILISKATSTAVTKGRGTLLYKDKLLQADVFTVYGASQNDDNLSLDHVKAEGNVIISSPTEIVKADSGKYYATSKLVELFDNVTLTRQEGQLQGHYARYDLVSGQSQLFQTRKGKGSGNSAHQRVQGILMPKQKH